MQNLAPGNPVHLVHAFVFVSGLLAPSQSGIKHNVANGLDVNSDVESLEQKLVYQSRAHDRRRRRGDIAKIIVIDVEVKALTRLQVNGEIAAADARSGTDAVCGSAQWIVGNNRVIDRDC